MADARRVQHPQRAIPLGTPLLEVERVVGRTAQRPIGLRSKRGAREAMGKGKPCPLGRTIDDRRSGCFCWFRLVGRGRFGVESGSKLGGAKPCSRELLPQFQPEVPNPLSEDLGKFLAPGSMRVPSIRILLIVFIGQHGLKRATVQIQIQHIRGSKRWGGKRTDKELVNGAVSLDADCGRRGGGVMGSYDQTRFRSGRC